MTKQLQKLHHITASGKYRNWKKHRYQAIALASAYKQLGVGFHKKSERVFSCARSIDFNKLEPDKSGQSVRNRYGCKDRLCPGCQSSRSRKTFMELLQLYELYHLEYPNDRAAMLTLTVPNVPAHAMQGELSALLTGFRKLSRRKPFARAVRAWFRALEVTYNPKTKTYHPHIHALLLFHPNYFDKSQALYLHHSQWLTLWQQVMRRPDIKLLDIRVLRASSKQVTDKAMASAIAEVAKYATKPADIFIPVGKGYTVNPLIILALSKTLKHRRLIAFSGLFRELRREMTRPEFQPSRDDPDRYFWLDATSEMEADYYLQQSLIKTQLNEGEDKCP